MSDSWLDNGHGDGLSLAPVRSVHTPESGVTVGARPGVWRSRSGRTFVAVVAAAAVIGSAGTAYAIRETLFPNIGAPTARSVWQNPVPVDEPASVAATTTTSTSTTTSTTTSQTTSTTSTTMPSTSTSTSSDDANARVLGVPTNPDDSDDPPSLSDDSASSGAGSNDPATDVVETDESDAEVNNSGSGADDAVESEGSGSDDDVDDLDD